MTALIKKQFPAVTCIAGVATAGIPIGAILADELQLPFIYVRSKPKEHGLRNTIEGVLQTGDRVVVIEDTISTGKSSLQAVNDLQEAGATIEGMVAIYSYAFPSTDKRFEEKQIPLYTLTNYDALLDAAIREGIIPHTEVDTLSAWRNDPGNWKK